jgi:hypothetical protein
MDEDLPERAAGSYQRTGCLPVDSRDSRHAQTSEYQLGPDQEQPIHDSTPVIAGIAVTDAGEIALSAFQCRVL